jgi:hypothetical protein
MKRFEPVFKNRGFAVYRIHKAGGDQASAGARGRS